jgi:hypothetical protein
VPRCLDFTNSKAHWCDTLLSKRKTPARPGIPRSAAPACPEENALSSWCVGAFVVEISYLRGLLVVVFADADIRW